VRSNVSGTPSCAYILRLASSLSGERDEHWEKAEEKKDTHFNSKELDPSDQDGIILSIQLLRIFPDKCTKVVIVDCFLVLSLALSQIHSFLVSSPSSRCGRRRGTVERACRLGLGLGTHGHDKRPPFLFSCF
jgi:DNA polymerase III delta prime subunit